MTSALGARMLERGMLDADELARAERVAAEHGLPLEEAIVKLGILTEDQAGALLAEEHGVPYVFPYASALDPELVARFPAELLRRHEVVPLAREGDAIAVAASRPLPDDARAELEAACGLPIACSLAARRRVKRVLAELFGAEDTERAAAGGGRRKEREGAALDDPGAVALLYGHLARALIAGATEVRFEPGEDAIRVRYRLDDRLEERAREPLASLLPLIARAQVLIGGGAPAEGGLGARRTIQTNLGGRELTLDIAILPSRGGESLLLRLSPAPTLLAALEDWRLPFGVAQALARAACLRHGLVLVASRDLGAARRLLYALGRAADPAGRAVVAVEREALAPEPAFRQVEIGARPLGAGLAAALAFEPDVLLAGVPAEGPDEAAALVRAATRRLVVAASEEPDAVEAAIALLERGARPTLLARVLRALVAVEGESAAVLEPGPALREAIETAAAPAAIRARAAAERA